MYIALKTEVIRFLKLLTTECADFFSKIFQTLYSSLRNFATHIASFAVSLAALLNFEIETNISKIDKWLKLGNTH